MVITPDVQVYKTLALFVYHTAMHHILRLAMMEAKIYFSGSCSMKFSAKLRGEITSLIPEPLWLMKTVLTIVL